jgi:hypothetical protein
MVVVSVAGDAFARAGHTRARGARDIKANPLRFAEVGDMWATAGAAGQGMSLPAPSGSRTRRGGLNPAALPVADAALVLSRAGGTPVSEEMLRADIEAGAPTNADGTVNLVHYAAWLVREMSGRGD